MTDKANGHLHDIDHDAFAEIVRQYYQRVYLAALSVTRQRDMTEDITQETFLRAWLRREMLSDSAMQLQPWLIRIATNLSVDWLRRGQSRSRVLPAISLEEIVVEPADKKAIDPRQVAARQEESSQLEEAILALPDELRLLVMLHYGDGMNASEIARLNGEAASTVTRRLEKARGLLRQYLGSGTATSLAEGARKLRAQPGSLARALSILSLAAAAPATTQAQLLQLVSDTPTPPLIDPVTSAAAAANIQETGFMNSILTKLGAAKLIGGIAVAAALGGGLYGVNQLVGEQGSFETQANSGHTASARITSMSQSDRNDRTAYVRGSAGRQRQSRRATTGTSESDTETSRRRLSPQERLALLTNDTISSHPQVIKSDGETTGMLHFNLEIVDESGLPVKDADVMIEQLIQSHRGSMSYGTTETTVKSNAKGIARVSVPRIFHENVPTDGIVVVVKHPEYAKLRKILMFSDLKKLVLRHGETLKIYAYDESTSAPIRSGIEPTLGTHALSDLDWDWSTDGAIVIRKISPDSRLNNGRINFYLAGETAKGEHLISDYQSISFPRTTEEPLHIPLRKTITVSGKLSPNVQRPVENGEVVVVGASAGGRCGSYQFQTATIEADGTFSVSDVPPGKILVWALAHGWSSTGAVAGDVQGRPQTFEVSDNNSTIELEMEETATVDLTVVDKSGTPIPGLKIVSWPNMRYENCASYWIRTAEANTDASGRAVLFDLPPLDQITFEIQGSEWEFAPISTRSAYVRKSVAYNLKSGETIKDTVIAYPKGTTVITQQGDQITTQPASD